MTSTQPGAAVRDDENERPASFSIRDLVVEFTTAAGVVRAVDHLSYDVCAGETLGVVGETGSGKSVSVLTALGLLSSRNVHQISGSVLFNGVDLLALSGSERRTMLGRDLGIIFQDPMSALNPVMSIGDQIAEALMTHEDGLGKRIARRRSIELLAMVGVPQPDVRAIQYPHEFSGGMQQRAMIAMAIANQPKVLVADEPTTALDVTVQAQLLDLLRLVQRETRSAIIFITHDLGVIAEMADRVCVMYAGRVVEVGPTAVVLARPRHPYTLGLLSSIPALGAANDRLTPIEGQPPDMSALPRGCAFHPRCALATAECRITRPALDAAGPGHQSACHHRHDVPARSVHRTEPALGNDPAPPASTDPAGNSEPLLQVDDLVVHFPIRSGVLSRQTGAIHAVDGVTFSLAAGETLGLVGESGCGKSTTGHALIRLEESKSGRIAFDGHDIGRIGKRELRLVRQHMQIVFQDPFASLNPTLTAGDNIAEPLRVHGGYSAHVRRRRVLELLGHVGLRPDHADRLPSEMSGGQRQRIGIARALALRPRLLILDEPVSSLDVSVQAQVLNLLKDLQQQFGLSYLFISHDLSVVRHMSDRVAVMYLGKIVEQGPAEQIYRDPRHPYTQALLSAVSRTETITSDARGRILLTGDLPSPANPPTGCRFRTRCWKARELCATDEPLLKDRDTGGDHPVACHYAAPLEVSRREYAIAEAQR